MLRARNQSQLVAMPNTFRPPALRRAGALLEPCAIERVDWRGRAQSMPFRSAPRSAVRRVPGLQRTARPEFGSQRPASSLRLGCIRTRQPIALAGGFAFSERDDAGHSHLGGATCPCRNSRGRPARIDDFVPIAGGVAVEVVGSISCRRPVGSCRATGSIGS